MKVRTRKRGGRAVFRLLDWMWYGPRGWGRLLAPAALLFALAVRVRRALFGRGLLRSRRAGAPVVVVGNLAAGGTGKTPLVIWLAERLRAHGYRPGVLCSGYRGRASRWPLRVRADADPDQAGDEAVLLARRCDCPVAAGPDRAAAAELLVCEAGCDILVCDDGLQHYRLARDLEIAVVDGRRRHGTGWCLPAGPLREPVSRLAEVDFVVVKGEDGDARRGEYAMRLEGGTLHPVADGPRPVPPGELPSRDVHALAGIGHPAPFFERLAALGLRAAAPRAFPDHHRFSARDLDFGDGLPVVMTEKDAVKCRAFADARHWYLPVRAELDPAFEPALLARIARLRPPYGPSPSAAAAPPHTDR